MGVESHQRMIDGLRDGDLAAVCEEIRTHIESHLHRLPDSETEAADG